VLLGLEKLGLRDRVQAVDHARLVRGSVPDWRRVALPVKGVLFMVLGRGVFVSYGGALYGPAGAARLSYMVG
jgi:hypothetical protein